MLQALTSGAQPVTQIAAGQYHSLFLKSDGSLWVMGWNMYGQLGDGTYNQTNLPEQIVVASNVTAIAAGADHCLLLKSDGSLWGMGANSAGQLGDGVFNSVPPHLGTNQPQNIVASNVTAISAGAGHSLFLKSDGSLWVMGYNHYGQLGDGTYNNTNRPEQIVASNVTAIAAGGEHSLFIKNDGSLWAMGYNNNGQLGDGTANTTNRPEQILASNITAVAAGSFIDGQGIIYEHSLFLKNDGSLWTMGNNRWGQLGDGTFNNTNLPEQIVPSNVTAIAAGAAFSLFLKSDGSLWGMGLNYVGELGDGTFNNNTNRPAQIVASGVMAIAIGGLHSLFLKSDGSLWGMGNGYYGQLGDGTYSGLNSGTNRPEQILGPYNQIQAAGQLMGGTNMQLSFVGIALKNYALDRASSLSPPNWITQATNPAGSFGALMFTNAPDATTNNFWRIRSVP
jgi:alpha-tubulin suppressor-like RCC1 family protein